MSDGKVVTGIAWYRRDQWARLRDLASDSDKLEESYEDWLAGAKKTLVELALTGVRTRRVEIDVDALVRWCQAEARPLDSSARAAFAALELRRAHERASPE